MTQTTHTTEAQTIEALKAQIAQLEAERNEYLNLIKSINNLGAVYNSDKIQAVIAKAKGASK